MPAPYHSPGRPGDRSPGPGAFDAVRELDTQRAALHRNRSRFAALNGALFAVTLLLACVAGPLMARRVFGPLTVGLALGAAQGVVLLWSAWRYDRFSGRHCDPRAAVLRTRAEELSYRVGRASARADRPHGRPVAPR